MPKLLNDYDLLSKICGATDPRSESHAYNGCEAMPRQRIRPSVSVDMNTDCHEVKIPKVEEAAKNRNEPKNVFQRTKGFIDEFPFKHPVIMWFLKEPCKELCVLVLAELIVRFFI